MTPTHISRLFRRIDRELWLVTAAAGTTRGGLIATFVGQAALPPTRPRMLIGIAKQHHTHGLIERSGAFALHLLTEGQLEWVWRFGLQSGARVDKLAGLAARTGASGAPLLDGVPAWLDCRVETSLDTGDRTVFVGAVLDGGDDDQSPFLTARRMLELAPADRQRELKEQLDRDCRVDEALIDAWRKTRPAAEKRETSPE